MSYITISDVRDEMYDRTADDHLVLAELAFEDADIEWAMKSCARKFNSIKPLCCSVTEDRLPRNSTVFFDGIAWALYRRWHANVSVNDYDYSAGGVNARAQGSLKENLWLLVQKLEEEFVQRATDLKLTANIQGAWGQIG